MEPGKHASEGPLASFNITIHTHTPVTDGKGESYKPADHSVKSTQRPTANAMHLKMMLNASDDESISSSEIEADDCSSSDTRVGSAAPEYLSSIQRVRSEPAPTYPSLDWNPENKLPPLQIGCFPPPSVPSSQDRIPDKLTGPPQVFHRRKSSPGYAHKHQNQGDYRVSKRLPIRSIQPQPRRSMSTGSQKKHWDERSSRGSLHAHIYDEQAFVEDDDENISSKKRASHSNKPYTPEQVHWIRYMKEDCGLRWKDMPARFSLQFPDAEPRESDQCFSARFYRDNEMPEVDDELNLTLGLDGKARWVAATVRSRSTQEGRAVGFPSTLVELRPDRAMKYPWVSNEHRERARRILCTPDPNDVKEKHRANLRYIEANGL